MNSDNWTENQWETYETAKVLIPVTLLENLILAANAHHLGVKVSSGQKRYWRDQARDALTLVDKVIAKVEVI